MTNPEVDNRVSNSKNNDDKVIITAIILGIGGGIGLLFLCVPAVTSAFLFSLGGSAMLYRFLGGTSGNTFEIKGLKASASAAILIVGTIGLNSVLENQLQNPGFTPRRCTAFEPNSSEWVPISRDTGLPTLVTYSGTDKQVVKNLDSLDFSKTDLSLNESGEISNGTFKLGRLIEKQLSRSISIDIEFSDVYRSEPIKVDDLSEVSGFPFKIKVLCVQDCFRSHQVEYQLLKNSNEVIGSSKRSIDSEPSREFHVFQLDNTWYFVSVLESCRDPSSCQSRFVRFLVGKINSDPKFLK